MERKHVFYITLVTIIALLVLSFFILRIYFTAIVFAAVFAYWFSPLHARLSKVLKPTGSALLLSCVIFVGIMAAIQYGTYIFVKEIGRLAANLASIDLSQMLSFIKIDIPSWISPSSVSSQFSEVLTGGITKVLQALPHFFISIFIFIIVFFYLLRDGDKLYAWMEKNFPLPEARRKRILDDVKGYVDAFVRVLLMIGLIQGIACSIGFYLFGLKEFALIAGIAVGILSILPIIGPYALYLPVGAFLILNGDIMTGIGLLIYGLAVGSFLDYIVRPHLAGFYSKIHPLIILIGVIGGMAAFGAVGIIIGPIILSVTVVMMKDLDLKAVLLREV